MDSLRAGDERAEDFAGIDTDPSELDGEDQFSDDPVAIPSGVSGSFLVGKVLKEDGKTPVEGAVVKLATGAGDDEISVVTDADGNFKIDYDELATVDIIITYTENDQDYGRLLSGIATPGDNKAADLGDIVLELTGAIRGQFLLNALDHPDELRGDTQKTLNVGHFRVEAWKDKDTNSGIYWYSDPDGTFLIRSLPPGEWYLKIGHSDGNDIFLDGFTQKINVVAGRTTQMYPGSAANYGNRYFASIISGYNESTREITVLDMAPEYYNSTTHIVIYDKDNNAIRNYVTEYNKRSRETVITLPENAHRLEMSYRQTQNWFSDDWAGGIYHSPYMVFDVDFNDTDGDGFTNNIDCDKNDGNKHYWWSNIALDNDNDGYYAPPEDGICGGPMIPEGYQIAKKEFQFDWDDNDPVKQQTPYGNAMVFETTDDPDVADIYFISNYTVETHTKQTIIDENGNEKEIDVAQPVTLTLPKLTKKTILYFANYDNSPWHIIAPEGSEYITRVIQKAYHNDSQAKVYSDTDKQNLVTGYSRNGEGIPYLTADGVTFENWYGTKEWWEDGNYARAGMITLPLLLKGEIKFFYASYTAKDIDMNTIIGNQ